MMNPPHFSRVPRRPLHLNRRSWLKSSSAAVAGLVASHQPSIAAQVESDFRVQRGRIKQSIMGWTFNPMPTPDLARHCKEIGLVAMEGIDAKFFLSVNRMN